MKNKKIWVDCKNCGLSRFITVQQTKRDKYTGLCADCNRKSHTGIKNPNWKGGRRVGGSKGEYVLILAPEHPYAVNGYVLEHRLVVEKRIGRHLSPEEIVHHLNGIPNDNRDENLVVVNRENHESYTYIKALQERIKQLEQVSLLLREETLKAVGEWLANLTISGNAVANELRIVEGIVKLKRGEMPELRK